MSYQVIARKWRPQTFDEVTGQEHITRTLRNAVEHERLHHAYLFSGARGVGKTTTARLLAKAVNCHKSDRPTPTPCRTTDPDACPSCREIAEGRSIDVLEIDAASNTGVDNVRDAIINTVGVRPARDRYKVFIIDEVHMLSAAAFNALLKTLEEPPPRVLFIMATTHPHKVPETILSRSQQFEFRTIAAARIAERLRLIADAEKIKVSDDALREIARAGERSMRDAQSAFAQVISFSEVEMRRLAPLGQIIERLNALEESLRGGRTPAGGAGSAQTPPASSAGSAGVPPRRGSAAGGGRGPSSFSAEVSSAAPPFGGSGANARGVNGAGDAKGVGDAGKQTPPVEK